MRKALFLGLLACSSQPVVSDASDAMDEEAGIALPCAPSGLSKGPWSLAMSEHAITVRWETCHAATPSGIFFAPENQKPTTRAEAIETPFDVMETFAAALAPQNPKDYAGRWYMHNAHIENLAPGTCYRYELEIDRSVSGRFCTSHLPGEEIRFLAIGDTNATLGDSTRDVLAHALPRNPEFTVHGGDIEYYASTFETYAAWFPIVAPLLRQSAFEPAMGNHEYETKWKYAEYSQRFWGGAGTDGTDEYYRYESGGVWFFTLDTEQSLDLNSPQGSWLVASLSDASQKNGYRFSVVVVHRPFLTCGDSDDHPADLAALSSAFDQYRVPLVIQAHMHGYERFEHGGRTFVTAAGGGGLIADPSKNLSRAYCSDRVRGGPYFHAVIFDVVPGKLYGTAISDSGEIIDQFDKLVP